MIEDSAKQKLRRLMEAREKRDAAKVAKEEAEAEYREIEAEVHEALSESGLKRIPNLDLGPPWGKVSFQAKETTFGRVIDDDAALEHFEQRAMVDQLTSPKFVMKRIHELVRTAKEAGEKMPPGLDYYDKPYVSITREKKS